VNAQTPFRNQLTPLHPRFCDGPSHLTTVLPQNPSSRCGCTALTIFHHSFGGKMELPFKLF